MNNKAQPEDTKIMVNCFTATRLIQNPVNIKTLYTDFLGEHKETPICFPHEGGSYDQITYSCCVADEINVVEICQKYGYVCGKLYPMEIQKYQYSNNYEIHPRQIILLF
jgi:hypothetical protein